MQIKHQFFSFMKLHKYLDLVCKCVVFWIYARRYFHNSFIDVKSCVYSIRNSNYIYCVIVLITYSTFNRIYSICNMFGDVFVQCTLHLKWFNIRFGKMETYLIYEICWNSDEKNGTYIDSTQKYANSAD